LLGVPMPEVRITGARPGEKLFEELLSRDELPRAREGERLLTVFPSGAVEIDGGWTEGEITALAPVTREWNSATDTYMSRSEIVQYLREERVLAPFLAPGSFS
jgi:FlaA1/EpsC-like NDP-sugar epimerase